MYIYLINPLMRQRKKKLICFGVYIRDARYHLKACLIIFPLVHVYLICYVLRVSRCGTMSKVKCCKIAPIFGIQHTHEYYT